MKNMEFGILKNTVIIQILVVSLLSPATSLESFHSSTPKCDNTDIKSIKIHTPRITGGRATPGEFPWMVAIFDKKGKQFCAGSLINSEYVLTASHCFASFSSNDITRIVVHIGDHNLKNTLDSKHETRKIQKVVLHKGFDIKTYQNDIALLKLDRPTNFSNTVQPICIPRDDSRIGEQNLEGAVAVVAGWGQITSGLFGLTSNVLRKVEIPIWKLSDCIRIFNRFAPGRLGQSQLCAGDGKKNRDACIGDSGGPLMLQSKYLIGIVSWGKGCGSFPGVYTDTRKFKSWIIQNMRN